MTYHLTLNDAVVFTWMDVPEYCRAMGSVPAPTFVVLMAGCEALPEDAICVKLTAVKVLVHSKKAAIIPTYELFAVTTVTIPCVPEVIL